jgi:hypothetical protein
MLHAGSGDDIRSGDVYFLSFHATPAHNFALTMERLFSPCSRHHRDNQFGFGEFRRDPGLLNELKLDVSTEELFSAERAFTYEDLYAMLGNEDTVAWLTPHAAVVQENGRLRFSGCLREDCRFLFNVNGKNIVALARSYAALTEIVDVVCRLLIASAIEVSKLELRFVPDEVVFDTPNFVDLLEQCQNLKALTLENITLDERHCSVLENFSEPGLEVELKSCRILGAGAEVLSEVLRRDKGPTKVNCCDIDSLVLANGLCGNSRLKSLTHHIARDQGLFPFTRAFRENKGLVDVELQHDLWMIDETWIAVCDSLKTHPTLQVLRLISGHIEPQLQPARLNSRIQALVDMLKVNMSIVEIHLLDY